MPYNQNSLDKDILRLGKALRDKRSRLAHVLQNRIANALPALPEEDVYMHEEL